MDERFVGIEYNLSELEARRPGKPGRTPKYHPWSSVPRKLRFRCYMCGTVKIRDKSDTRLYDREGESVGKIFCGRSCSAKYNVRNSDSGRSKRDLHRFCAECREKFTRPVARRLTGSHNGELPHNDRAYCCGSCAMKDIHRRDMSNERHKKAVKTKRQLGIYDNMPKGPDHPSWKGVADVMDLVRSWSSDNWRPEVYKLDDYTCQSCGDDSGGNLNAHHIEPLSEIVWSIFRENDVKPEDMTSEERSAFVHDVILTDDRISDVDNGITLCESCHVKVHR